MCGHGEGTSRVQYTKTPKRWESVWNVSQKVTGDIFYLAQCYKQMHVCISYSKCCVDLVLCYFLGTTVSEKYSYFK